MFIVTILCLLVVAVAAVLVCVSARSTDVPRSGVRGGRAVVTTHSEQFTWSDISDRDSEWFSSVLDRHVPPGAYASEPMNQHGHAWCGACWLVACVQVVQDKLNIREAPAESHMRDHRAFAFDMQAAADDAALLFAADVLKRDHSVGLLVSTPRQWTACMGGEPSMALEAMRVGTLRLGANRSGASTWQSRSDPSRAGRVPGDIVVRSVRSIDPNPQAFKNELLNGPLVVCTRSAPLWSLDSLGRTSAGSGERDHVMAIIGWTTVGGKECWITRNSWGADARSAVHSKPEDVRGCAGGKCAAERAEWNSPGDRPGFVYIPTALAENAMGVYDSPSGCFAVDV